MPYIPCLFVLAGPDENGGDLKAKNVRQTELVSDLKDAVLQIGRHFQSIDPKNAKIVSKSCIFLQMYKQIKLFSELGEFLFLLDLNSSILI